MSVDLFDFLPEFAEQRRVERAAPLIDALTCLRDEVPEALYAVVYLEYEHERDTRAPHAGNAWAYCLCKAGLRHERARHWWQPTDGGSRGWDRTPANLTTWAELAELVGEAPRRAEVRAWADSLEAPRWKTLLRPKELWPSPEHWHPSHIELDRERPDWDERIHAWRTVQSILTDAIEALS